jgi:glycosyltransferase involved in cell wall biosynthesis
MTSATSTRSPAPASPARPRILHCITWLALGGAERSTLNIVHALRDRFDFGIHTMRAGIHDAVGRQFYSELVAGGLPWFDGTRLPVKRGGMLTGGLSLGRAIRRFRPDIIHLHTEIPESGYAALVALRPALRRITLARTIHNSFYWHHWTRLGLWAERRMPPAHIVGVSQDSIAAYETFSRRAGTRPLSTQVIYNGSRPPPPAEPPARVPGAPVRLLFAGRFEYQKGTDLLPEILARVPREVGDGTELSLIGSGEHDPLLRRLAADPPAGWRIRLEGPQPDLAKRFGDFDLILMPSRFEGLGMVSIEALLRQVPIVATSAPGLREAFPPDYPWLAAPGDAADFARVLTEALRDRGKWSAVMAAVQPDTLERFSLERTASRYEAFYRRILGR